MNIERVEQHEDCWILQGSCRFELKLKRALPTAKHFNIGTIGTRRSEGIKVKSPLHLRFAEALTELGTSVILVDTRRNGCGAQGSWTPLELATLVPEHFSRAHRSSANAYLYLHLPILAPSVDLLTHSRKTDKQNADGLAENKSWEEFRTAYLEEITRSQAILIGRALVEHATVHSAMAVFLCAEPFEPDFDQNSLENQNANYCHRFTLARAISRSLQADFFDSEIQRVDLSIGRSSHKKLMSRSPLHLSLGRS